MQKWFRNPQFRCFLYGVLGSLVAVLVLFFVWQLITGGDFKGRQFAQVGGAVDLEVSTSSGEPLSLQEINEGLQRATDDLARQVRGDTPLRIVTIDFTNVRGISSDVGRYFSDRISTLLAQHGQFTVMEQEHLVHVLDPLDMELSDLLDPPKARRIAQLVRLDAFVTGTVSSLEEFLEVNVRLVDIESGTVLASALARIPQIKEEPEEPRVALITPSPPTILDFRFPQVVHKRDLSFSLEFCEVQDIYIACRVTAWNNGDDERSISIDMRRSYLVGVNSRQYSLLEVEPFSDEPAARRRRGWDLPPNTRRGLDLKFGTQGLPVDRDIASVVIEFNSYPGGRGFPDKPKVVFSR